MEPAGNAAYVRKRKDPVFHGEIVLDSQVNVHHVSLDPINQQVRDDALRKRIERNSLPLPADQKDFSSKRRCLLPPQKNATVTVVVGEHHYYQTFVIRTSRDMNKYRYKRKCIEFWGEASVAMSDETQSTEE